MNLQKISNLERWILKTTYLNWPNLDGHNDLVLFSLITSLLDKNLLIIGPYGMGKTTVAETLNCLIYGYPYQTSESSKIVGSPQQTEEKISGRPDIGSIASGREEVVWSLFSILYPALKVVDEINRFPASLQTLLIHSIDRGEITYLNEQILYSSGKFGKTPFIATCNPKEVGNYPISEAILDRFSLGIETQPPFSLWDLIFSKKEEWKNLKNEEIHLRMLSIATDKHLTVEAKWIDLDKLRNEYKQYLINVGIPTLQDNEILEFREEVKKMKVDDGAKIFLTAFFDEVNALPKGIKNVDAKYNNTVAGVILTNLGPRAYSSVIEYSKALSLLKGKSVATLEEVLQVLPYIMLHRVLISGNVNKKFLNDVLAKEDFATLTYISKKIVSLFWKQWLDNKDIYEAVYYPLVIQGNVPLFKRVLANYNGNLVGILRRKRDLL